MWRWGSRPIHEPTASSDAVIVCRSSERSARRGARAVRQPLATVSRPRRRLRWSSHGSGDCPTTTWYRVSFGILKHPPAARTDACEVSDANSSCSLAAAAGSARGSTVTVTTSAEAVSSAIRRLSHHHMMSGNVCTGLELVCRPYNGRVIMEYALSSPSGG